jgi:hypothetical protein
MGAKKTQNFMLISNLLKKLQKVINEKVMYNRVFDIDNSVQKFLTFNFLGSELILSVCCTPL